MVAERRHQDYLIYPVLTLYRHYIELTLKGLLRDLRTLLDEDGGVPAHHRLDDLWRDLRRLLLQIAPGSEEELDIVENSIRRFAWIDPTSQASRYPVDKQGRPPLPADISTINLRQMKDVVERMNGFFEAVDMEVTAQLDYKADTEQEWLSIVESIQR